MMTPQQAYLRLGLVLLIFGLITGMNSIWLPLHKAPDEIAHFQYSRFIAAHSRLPINYEEREAAGFKSDWPPLYHILVAGLTGWSDSPDPPYLKFVWESPRFDMVRELLDTKRLANTEDELRPYRGVVRMWHLGRLVSIVLSMGTIVVTFFTALQFFPGSYDRAIVAAAIIALVPTFTFISSALSDDPLLALVMGLYLLMAVKIVKGDDRLRNYGWLGLLMGLAVTTKYSTVILPLQAMIMIAYLAWRSRWGWSGWLKRISVTGLAAMVASSWWFGWVLVNFQEIERYGPVNGLLKPLLAGGIDPSQKYVASLLTGGTIGTTESPDIVPVSFLAWLEQIYRSFWVISIGDDPLGLAAHALIGLVCLGAAIGLVRLWLHRPVWRVWLALLVLQVGLFLIFPYIRFLILGHPDQSAQGRHVLFPTATILPLLMILGWSGWCPSPPIRRRLALAVIGGLACWSLAQTIRIATFYPPPLPVRTTPEVIAKIPHPLDKQFGPHLHLRGYDLQLQPEASTLDLSLFWQSPTYPNEDYRMEIRLMQADQTRLHWLAYPINGRYPTRAWERWETIRDDLSFPLLDLPPGTYRVQLQMQGVDGPLPVAGQDRLELAEVTLPAMAVPEPERRFPVTVAGQEVISGFSLWQAEAYRELDLPIYRPRMAIPIVWQGRLSAGYRVEWLLVDPQGQVYPSRPASPHFDYFVVGADWSAGDYRLRAEVWRDETVVASQETGPLVTIFNERPRPLQPGPIAYPLAANFADHIELLGYDLPVRSLSPGQGVPVTLYWRGLRTMGQSYTVFTKLLDDQQQVWGSAERLPADGYSTVYWLENEVVTDSFELPVMTGSPPGLYWLNVGLYEEVDDRAVSLPLVLDGQLSEITSLTVGPIKIGGPPPGVVLSPAAVQPEVTLSTEFGRPPVILLRGYDLRRMDGTLKLTLYWESLSPTPVDWNAFVHLRTQAGKTAAQSDGPLGSGRYPTSVWAAGELVADEFAIPLAELPDDVYNLYLGLYNLTTGERLPVMDNPDREILLIEAMPLAESPLSLQTK